MLGLRYHILLVVSLLIVAIEDILGLGLRFRHESFDTIQSRFYIVEYIFEINHVKNEIHLKTQIELDYSI